MADLQAALKEYKLEVASLDKQKTDLTREIPALKSKKSFLTVAIDKLNKVKSEAQASYDAKLKQLKSTEAKQEELINIAQEDLDAVLQAQKMAESELETLEQQHEQEIIGHNKRLSTIKNEVKAVEVLKADAIKELNEASKQVSIRQARFQKLDETVKQAELQAIAQVDEFDQLVLVAKQRLSKTDDKVEDALKTLEDLQTKAIKKQVEIDDMAIKKSDFLAYEKRAMAALKARESALLQGEANLATARRRNPASVLDNLG